MTTNPSSDVLERLRLVDISWSETGELCAEAAATIERLSAERFDDVVAAYTSAIGAPPDRVTIYRVLDRLVEAGLCDRRVGADRINRFSRHVEAASGNIFECDQCHKVLALPSDPELPKVMSRLGRELRKQGIDTRRTALTLHGTCGECRG